MSKKGHFMPFVKKSEPFTRKSKTQGKSSFLNENLVIALVSEFIGFLLNYE